MTKQRKQGKRNHIAASWARDNRTFFLPALHTDTRNEALPLSVKTEGDKIYELACKYSDYDDNLFPINDLDSSAIAPLFPEEMMPAREAIRPRVMYPEADRREIYGLYSHKRRRHAFLKDLRTRKMDNTRTIRQQHLIDAEPEDIMHGVVFAD